MTDERSVRAALESLQVPSSLIAGVNVRQDVVTVVLETVPARVQALEPFRAEIERSLKEKIPQTRIQVVVTADKAAQPAQKPVAPQVRSIIAVASGKGGVGKSTVAVNLALAAAGQGLKVGILDADIYGPSQPILLGLHDRLPAMGEDRRIIPAQAFGLKVMSMGLMVDPDKALVWRGPMVHSAINQMLRDVEWGELDVLLIDMPPGTGDAQLSIAQNARLAGAIIVTTPQDLALADARRAVTMFRQVNVPVLGLIENMSLYHCPNCGHEAHIFGHGGAKDEAKRLGLPFLGELPLALAVRAGDSGMPVVAAEPQGAIAKIFREMAEALNLNR